MKCHYENINGVGKVLIPGCMAVAISQDITDCTCKPTKIMDIEKREYKEHVKELEKRIRELEEENDFYAKVLAENEIKNPYEKRASRK
jgi:hypothetical protein